MPEYPRGTVAFLFTDIEGSTARWERDATAMWQAVERHFVLLRAAIEGEDGVLFKTVGDAVQAAFPAASNALRAAVSAQVALGREDWDDLGSLRVRMAIHVGEASPIDGDYLAPALNRLARVLGAGYGEQILLTEAARHAVGTSLPPGCDLLDLGAHRLRDLLQAEHIYQVRGPGLTAEFPPLKSLDRRIHNLPAQPTPLLGREADIAAAKSLLTSDDVRLVTLTGPGGTGKTRLGLQVAAELVDTFADGVWFVPLAGVTDPELVVSAIAQPLGVRELAGEPLLETVKDYLRAKHVLLLLDNFEQVIAAAPIVSAVLAAGPHTKVLVTSRESLRLGGEREMPVPPLALPDPALNRRLSPGALLDYPAVRLFVERAQAVKPGFALSDENAADVAAICHRLDGLPLAIELAAARIRVLPPRQLLARLDQRLKLLTGGSRDLPARQQTLRAAIEWSHDLLNQDEQRLFARLAVFAGGCTLEAAEVVCGRDDEQPVDVLDGLDSLTQKSLVRQVDGADGEPRFAMLETIREFGLECLDAAEDAESVRSAHAAFFLELAEHAEDGLLDGDQVMWLNRLGAEHDNFRAALLRLEQRSESTALLRLATALWRFWWLRGYLSEGREWLQRALERAECAAPEIRATALSSLAILAEDQGDFERAKTLHQQALEIRRQTGDQVAIATSLANLGINARVRGDSDHAVELQTQVLTIWRELGEEIETIGPLLELGRLAFTRGELDTAGQYLNEALRLCRKFSEMSALGPVLESLGMLSFYQEDYNQAVALYKESLEVSRALDDSLMIVETSVNLGEAIHQQGDSCQAESLYEEALGLARDIGDKRGIAFALAQRGKLAQERGDLTKAAALLVESMQLRQEVGELATIIDSLESIAAMAMDRSDPTRSVRLYAAADAMRTRHDIIMPPVYAATRERSLAAARRVLGTTAFKDAWQQGQRLTLEAAIAIAVQDGAEQH